MAIVHHNVCSLSKLLRYTTQTTFLYLLHCTTLVNSLYRILYLSKVIKLSKSFHIFSHFHGRYVLIRLRLSWNCQNISFVIINISIYSLFWKNGFSQCCIYTEQIYLTCETSIKTTRIFCQIQSEHLSDSRGNSCEFPLYHL